MRPQQTNATPNELEAALDYARRGIPVFPTNPLDKKPLTPNGFKDATADEAQIREWWQKWPNAMIAAPTGSASGMWVTDLDLDPAKKVDGMATLAQLIAQHCEIPKTLMTITPRGGRMRWLLRQPDLPAACGWLTLISIPPKKSTAWRRSPSSSRSMARYQRR